MFSKKCSYGIRAVIYLASSSNADFVSIQHISDKLDISFHFLTKILQTLTKNNIVTSYRGPKGGVVLARPAEEITLIEVVDAIDGGKLFNECVLGLSECGDDRPCPLHHHNKIVKAEYKALLEKTNIEEVANDVKKLNLRLET